MSHFDVMVIGGGIIGLTAAIGMRQRGFSVVVLDAADMAALQPFPDTRVYAINDASQKLFESLYVWSDLAQDRITPYLAMSVWDEASQGSIEFDARLMGDNRLGYMIEESVLKEALLKKAQALGVVCESYQRVQSLQYTAGIVQVETQAQSWQSQFLMVADGALSATRARLGVKLTTWPYHQQAIVTTVRSELPHQYTAWQVFTRNGPLAFLPLPDEHLCSIVWSTSIPHAQALMALSTQDFATAITQAFEFKLGHSQPISSLKSFPLHMRQAQAYAGAYWMLLGDAAHTIHPLAGLGLNVGLADVSTWLNAVNQSGLPLTNQKRLGQYQRQRKNDVWQIILAMELLKTGFASPLPMTTLLKKIGLNALNRSSILKRFFIQQAKGI